jgi:cell division protein FtsI (penicillin-binding protein 3)
VQRHQNRVRFRILFLTVLISVAGLTILARLVRTQVFQAEEFRRLARQQQEGIIELSPARGAIYDAAGRELAVSVLVDSVYVDPSRLDDKARQIRRLSKTAGVSARTLRDRVQGDGKRFAWVKRKVTPGTRERIESLDIQAAGFIPEYRRYYPKQTLAAHLLGYVGVDDQGLAGLEYGFDDRVQGHTGRRLAYRDARGTKIPMEVNEPVTEGRSLVLTVDEVVQHVVERELDRVYRQTRARAAMAVLIEPDTGRILAMANRPTYDPNGYSAATESTRRNRALTDCFEPGSTFKVFTWAAAWQDGKIHNGETINCGNGRIEVAGRTIRDHKKFGTLTVGEVLHHSSNVGAIEIGRRLGDKRFYRFLTRFGFGQPTGIRLPGETPGILHPPAEWSGVSKASLSIGHEVCVNAVQLTSALSAAINGGWLRRPWIIQAIVDEDGNTLESFGPADPIRVLNPATSERIRHELYRTVEDGSGQAARLPNFNVGGKTGTAQKIGDDGRYTSSRHVSTFFGFAPASRPAIALLVVVDEPQGKYYGSEIAAPVFGRIAPEVLHYLRVAPDRNGNNRPGPDTLLTMAAPTGGGAGR